MKLTKLFVAAAVLLAAVGAAFADEAKYNELLAKGKDYEAKKQWVYAMGTYWDAILEYPQGAKEANDGFNRIRAGFAEYNKSGGNFIGTGNPGPGEYDIFSRYDGWINVCREFEVYWNEHSDEIYYVPEVKYEKSEADMKSRTMTYDFKGEIDFTPKFSTIWHCIGDSFRKAYKDNWNDIPAQWPAVSMFKDSKTIPVVRFIGACNMSNPLVRSFEDLHNYTILGGGKLDFPPNTPKEYYVAAWNNYASISKTSYDESNLEIKIKVSDKNGKDFGTYISEIGLDYITHSEFLFSFKIQGISREDMGAFDNEELIVQVESLLSKTKNSTAEVNSPNGTYQRISFENVKDTAGPVIKLYREGNNSNPLELYAKEAKIAEIISKGKFESGVLKPRKIDKNCYTRIENLQGGSVATNVEGVVFAIPLSLNESKFQTKIDGFPVYCYDLSVRLGDDMSYMIDYFISIMNRRYNADFQVGITSDGKYCIYRAITDADSKELAAFEEKSRQEESEFQALLASKIHDGVLDRKAFSGNKQITSVTIPDSVKKIGAEAFLDCSSIKSVTIPSGVQEIEPLAFANCTSLTEITIPSSVKTIGYGAFNGCTSLKTVNYEGSHNDWMKHKLWIGFSHNSAKIIYGKK